MSQLRILNSPNARIYTECEHCSHVMKTTADSLYYLVECPNCANDFICTRYKPRQQKVEVSFSKADPYHRERNFLQTNRKYARNIYEFTVISVFAVNTFFIGLTNDFRILIWSLIFLFFLYVIQFLVNMGLDIQERQFEILQKLERKS